MTNMLITYNIQVTDLTFLEGKMQSSEMKVQDPPANRAIWKLHFCIFSLSGEGE